MRIVACTFCAEELRAGHHVKREDGAPHRDKCGVCGKKRWCGVYDIDVRAQGKGHED